MAKRNANRDLLRPLLVEALSVRSAQEWFADLSAAGLPGGPINTVAGGVQLAVDLGLEPVVVIGDGAAAVPTVRNPLRLSATPPDYRLPPPTLDQHGAEIRRWLADGHP
jgi:crotonobetainyl-CoA:carnitine CoA-transferase CaiB-like acyl-CoA transferase